MPLEVVLCWLDFEKGATVVLFISAEEYSCEFGSGTYYAYCGLGGLLSCGITHTLVTPLDLVKCRLQVRPPNSLF